MIRPSINDAYMYPRICNDYANMSLRECQEQEPEIDQALDYTNNR